MNQSNLTPIFPVVKSYPRSVRSALTAILELWPELDVPDREKSPDVFKRWVYYLKQFTRLCLRFPPRLVLCHKEFGGWKGISSIGHQAQRVTTMISDQGCDSDDYHTPEGEKFTRDEKWEGSVGDEIVDGTNDHNYFIQIPNIIDDYGLSPFALALYLHLKRESGASQQKKCKQTQKLLAWWTSMSTGMVTKAKKELLEAGLIEIEKAPSKHGEFQHDVITLLDIWPENSRWFLDASPEERRQEMENWRGESKPTASGMTNKAFTRSPHEQEHSQDE